MAPRLDDEIRRARAGDPRAFRAVTEILGPALLRFVTGFLRGDRHAACDVVQETLISAWRNLDHLDTPERLRPWLYHVAKCKAVSWCRRRGPRGVRLRSLDASEGAVAEAGSRSAPPPAHRAARGPLPGEGADDGEMTFALRRALGRLPRPYAGVIDLHYLRGFTTRETGRLLGLPRSTVKMRLHRARHFLRRVLRHDALRNGLSVPEEVPSRRAPRRPAALAPRTGPPATRPAREEAP